MLTTIDLTPVGMQTPEGIARVNAAIKEQEDSILECANLLIDMHESFRFSTLTEDQFELMVEVGKAVTRRKASSEGFLKAVAGR